MHLRRLICALSVVVVASGVVAAQPKKKDGKKEPAAGSAAGSGSAAGPAAGSAAGSAVAPIEEAPPGDMEGREENPDAPRTGGETDEPAATTAAPKATAYPIEEVLRPITLYKNMAEVRLSLHGQVDDFFATGVLQARYGITNRLQIGLTYAFAGIWNAKDVDNAQPKSYGVHAGKAVGLDVTYLLTNWAGVRLGLPLYIDPFAMSIAIGAPLKFVLADGKLALGALDDFLNISLPVNADFPPDLYIERTNAIAAEAETNNTAQSNGSLRLSGYGEYQLKSNLVIIGRLRLELDDFSQNRNASGHGGWITSIRAGAQYSAMPNLDIGGTLGFDDLAFAGSFGLQIYGAFRI